MNTNISYVLQNFLLSWIETLLAEFPPLCQIKRCLQLSIFRWDTFDKTVSNRYVMQREIMTRRKKPCLLLPLHHWTVYRKKDILYNVVAFIAVILSEIRYTILIFPFILSIYLTWYSCERTRSPFVLPSLRAFLRQREPRNDCLYTIFSNVASPHMGKCKKVLELPLVLMFIPRYWSPTPFTYSPISSTLQWTKFS